MVVRLQAILARCDLKKELDSLEKELVLLDSPVMFCHNDLTVGNIIYDANRGQSLQLDILLSICTSKTLEY